MKAILLFFLLSVSAFAQSTNTNQVVFVAARIQVPTFVDMDAQLPIRIYTNAVLHKAFLNTEVIPLTAGSQTFKFTIPGLAAGTYQVYATAVSVIDGECPPSNTITITATNAPSGTTNPPVSLIRNFRIPQP